MDKIKEQANQVGQLVFAAETGELYKKTFARTWQILRETGILLWLVICLTFVGGEWFYRTSVSLGRNARSWYNSLGEKAEATEADSIGSTGQALLDTVKSGTTYLLTQARQQLGLKEPAPLPTVTTPAAPPAPEPPAAAPVAAPVASAPKPVPSKTEPPAVALEDDDDDDEAAADVV
jgi:hypothetical protein